MQIAADVLGIHPVEVDAVSTFYSFLHPETQGQFVFRLCRTYSCELAGKQEVVAQLEHDLGIKFGETSADGAFSLEWANCMGMCDQGPAMLVNDEIYTKLTPNKVHEIVAGLPQARSSRRRRGQGRARRAAGRRRRLSERRQRADLLHRHPGRRPQEGAGHVARSTSSTWSATPSSRAAAAPASPPASSGTSPPPRSARPKYIMCNADEGEPGTFKDRLILSEYADLVMEGMTIGARAIGAAAGAHLPARRVRLPAAPPAGGHQASAEQAGLLGQNIGGIEGFNFNIMVAMGAGAYVCGEETALIESLEGFRGEPRNRPPFPVVSGFLNRPSVVNNVETLAWVPCILSKGVEWFKSIGTATSAGHKLFSVSGDCERPGVYEFPFGITIAELLEEVGGENAKAVQIGGASGRCVPRKDFERRLAFEDIPTGGSVIVIGPARDMLALAHNLMRLLRGRVVRPVHSLPGGQRQAARGGGDAPGGHLHRRSTWTTSEGLANTMQVASKCGLGQTSSVALLSILEHFGDEIHAR